jgi:hypothetical protein
MMRWLSSDVGDAVNAEGAGRQERIRASSRRLDVVGPSRNRTMRSEACEQLRFDAVGIVDIVPAS